MVVSQSYEPADSISVLKIVKENGAKIFCLTNVLGCSLARITDTVIYTRAAPEVSVAVMKSTHPRYLRFCK